MEMIWNRCDECGRFIALKAFAPDGKAARRLIYPDSEFTVETWETLCQEHTTIPTAENSR
jgi:hypothetical protein